MIKFEIKLLFVMLAVIALSSVYNCIGVQKSVNNTDKGINYSQTSLVYGIKQ